MDVEYKMIGGDGREYGPASMDEIKSWIREGRIAAKTLIWRSDLQTWSPASSFVEFVPELGPVRPAQPTTGIQANAVGFAPRLAAYLVDHFILGTFVYIIWAVFLSQTPGWEMPRTDFLNSSSVADMQTAIETIGRFGNKILVIFLPTLFLYEVIMNGTFGATIGKFIIGARIVRMDGTRIGYGLAAGRWMMERLSDMFLCYVGHFFVLFRGDKRALHDLVAGTRVIYKR